MKIPDIHATHIQPFKIERDEMIRAETLKEVRGGRICLNCGKPKEGTLTDLCDKCLEEE